MTQTAFTHRPLTSWFKACIATGAIAAAVLGTVTVAGGYWARSESAATSVTSGHAASSSARGGMLLAYRPVY